MLAVEVSALGSLADFRIADVPVPCPAPGEVLVRVHAAALGFVDGLIMLGRYQVKPPLPYTPGSEIAGVVAAIGERVDGVALGDRVAAKIWRGGAAEQCLVPAAALHAIGPALPFEKAATLLGSYATAYHGLRDRAALSSGETLLVLGAAGAVGTASIAVGKQFGAYVIAAASTPVKRELAKSFGADDVVNYIAPDWRDQLRDLTNGRGVDVVIDPVGGDMFEPAFRSLRWGGRHLVVGFASGAIPVVRTNLALLKGAALIGVDYRQFTQFEPERARANLRVLIKLAAAERLEVPTGAHFPLARFEDAIRATMDRTRTGKVMLVR